MSLSKFEFIPPEADPITARGLTDPAEFSKVMLLG
jgi:hypothetical protein